MKSVTEATRRWLPWLVNEIEHGPPPTPEQRAAYWQQRDNYGKTGPQQGLPFTTDKDAANGSHQND